MNPLKKLFYIISWIPVFLVDFFPLLIIKPFVGITWAQAFLPVGLVFLGAFLVVPLALLFKADMRTFPIWGNREDYLSLIHI